MAIESLRRYITSQTELESYLGESLSVFDNNNLIKAERDIDKAIASFRSDHEYSQSVSYITQVYESAVLTATTATIADIGTTNDGYFDYCTLEILSGSNKGEKIAIKSQSGTVLTFFDTQTGLSETSAVKIYQSGKIPRKLDTATQGSIYYKTIPEFIKEAVALQYQYRLDNADILKNQRIQSGYSVSKDSYSENFDTSRKNTIIDRISPEAYDLLNQYGLTTQSL